MRYFEIEKNGREVIYYTWVGIRKKQYDKNYITDLGFLRSELSEWDSIIKYGISVI